MIRRSSLILLAIAATACEARHQANAGAAVFDSAGVRVIDLGTEGWESGVHRVLSSEPNLVIRSVEEDGAPVLFEVRDVQPISGDRIAVANGGTNEILVFDAAGNHMATWGGVGEGPGEFRDLRWLTAPSPDTLVAGDTDLSRVSTLDANGRFVTSIDIPNLSAHSSGSVGTRPIARLRDGMLVTESAGGFAEEGPFRPEVELLVIDPEGDAPRSLGIFRGNEFAFFEEGGNVGIFLPPFARHLHREPSADGIWVGDEEHWALREYSSDGRLRTLIRSAESPEAVTDQLIEQHIDYMLRDVNPAIDHEPIKRLQRSIAEHATVPGFGVIRPMSGGGIAVGQYDTGGSSTRIWRTVDSSGTVTSVRIPTSFDVRRWGEDWILAIVRDELDREEVHRYRILADEQVSPQNSR